MARIFDSKVLVHRDTNDFKITTGRSPPLLPRPPSIFFYSFLGSFITLSLFHLIIIFFRMHRRLPEPPKRPPSCLSPKHLQTSMMTTKLFLMTRNRLVLESHWMLRPGRAGDIDLVTWSNLLRSSRSCPDSSNRNWRRLQQRCTQLASWAHQCE